jgi:FlaA1/EpsC-like NDP-sugar epimerase
MYKRSAPSSRSFESLRHTLAILLSKKELTMQSAINNFYNNQNIFVTGGTGFLGKVLVEKLLRSTDVASIYVLTRSKKGENAQTRFEEIFNTPVNM